MAKKEAPAYNERDFFRDLKAGKLYACYCLEGEEEFVKEKALSDLRAAVLAGPMRELNETRLTDPEADEVIRAAETLPLMAERRLLIVKDSHLLGSGPKAGEEGQADDADKLGRYLSQLPETTVIVFWVRGAADKRKRLYKALKDNVSSGRCVICSFERQSEDDLRKWTRLGCIFRRGEKGAWDAAQADGWPALVDTRWDGPNTLNTFQRKYWMMYLGGAADGYETDPLSTGVAWTDDPSAVREWTRYEKNPVLSPSDPDARDFEKKTIYKHFTVEDPSRSCGGRFVNFYNAKACGVWRETIGMAVSDDMLHWRRVGGGTVVENGDVSMAGISGDPMIRRIGDTWVMFYFGHQWKPGVNGAFDTFACSYDLKNWTKWEGEPLVRPSEPYDAKHAHKPWVLKHDGVVYHFYCAVGDKGRGIALATSEHKKEATGKTEDWALRIAGRSMWFSTAESSPGKMLVLYSSPWEADVSRDESGKVTLTYSYSHPDNPDWAWTSKLSFVPTDSDEMECEFFETRANRPGGDIRARGVAKRIPPLPPAPNLGKLTFGKPIDLLADGLDGWETIGDRTNLWTFKDGVLENGGRGGADIKTKRGDFTDFRLSYDVRADKGCNSGVYLRGIYEIQTIDSYGKEPDSHNMGAVYGRVTPSVTADRPAGEWQHVDVTLCDRHATVVLNGVKIIDNAPLRGITGGALTPDQFAPGPIMIQGSHNGGAYRNMVLAPIR